MSFSQEIYDIYKTKAKTDVHAPALSLLEIGYWAIACQVQDDEDAEALVSRIHAKARNTTLKATTKDDFRDAVEIARQGADDWDGSDWTPAFKEFVSKFDLDILMSKIEYFIKFEGAKPNVYVGDYAENVKERLPGVDDMDIHFIVLQHIARIFSLSKKAGENSHCQLLAGLYGCRSDGKPYGKPTKNYLYDECMENIENIITGMHYNPSKFKGQWASLS